MLDLNILQKRIDKLERLYPKIIRHIIKSFELDEGSEMQVANSEELDKLLNEYGVVKGKILTGLINESVFTIEHDYLKQLREKLQKLTVHGDPNIPEKFLDGKHDKAKKIFINLLRPKIPSSKEKELLDDFHSWYSGYDYIWNKMQTTLLVLKAGVVDESLNRYIREIRECLSFNRYLAATVLLRTSLEISLQDLCQHNGLNDKDNTTFWNKKLDFWEDQLREEKVDSRFEWDLNKITLENHINLLGLMDKFTPHLSECHQLRKELNKIVHNETELDRKVSMDLTHRTFQLIHELYETN